MPSAASGTKYVLDTSAFATLRRVYPADVFPAVWALLDRLADEHAVVAPELVFAELAIIDDDASKWAKSHKGVFVPTDRDIQLEVRNIVGAHPSLVDLKKKKSGADPFVIALGSMRKVPVVSEEKPSGGPQKMKIPDVCRAIKLECITVLEMLRREGLKVTA